MVCGEFGHGALKPYHRQIATFNAVLILLTICFGISGCASYSNNESSLSAVPWVTTRAVYTLKDGTIESDQMTSFGIWGFDTWKKDGTALYKQPEAYPLTNADGACQQLVTSSIETGIELKFLDANVDKTSINFCQTCQAAAMATITTGSLAIICAVTALIFELSRRRCDGTCVKDCSLVCCISSFIFGCISYARAQPCYTAISLLFPEVDKVVEGSTYKQETGYGAGAKVMAGAFACMLIVSCITIMVPVPSDNDVQVANEKAAHATSHSSKKKHGLDSAATGSGNKNHHKGSANKV